jgi:hypothetical protein
MDWFDDGFMPSLASLDANRLLMYEINGPLNLAPLYQNTSPIPANLAAYRAIPASPVLPPGVGPGNNEVVIDINIDQGNGGEGSPGPPGPDGNPGAAGADGGPGPDGDDVCTCQVRIVCSFSYANEAHCRVTNKIVLVSEDPECDGQESEAYQENSIFYTANHSSVSVFPPGTIGAGPVGVDSLDGFGGTDYDAGVRQDASARIVYVEKFTLRTGETLTPCAETAAAVDGGCIPICDEFTGLDPDGGETISTEYRVKTQATRVLTTLGYVDDGSEVIEAVRCDDGVTVTGDTGAMGISTTISVPFLCDGGPGLLPTSPLIPTVPAGFVIPPACCTDCDQADSAGNTITSVRLDELDELTSTPSRCLWDYADPMEVTDVTSSGGAATIEVSPVMGPQTWAINVVGNYSFLDSVSVPDDPFDPGRITTDSCEWYGSFEWDASVTIYLEPV